MPAPGNFVVSSSCFAAGGGQLAVTADEIRLLPTNWSPDEDIDCARAVTSIALLSIDPTELPGDLPITAL